RSTRRLNWCIYVISVKCLRLYYWTKYSNRRRMDKQVIGYIIQARMKSERLPGKVLLPLPLPDGEPLLGHIVRNIHHLDGVVVVATSLNKENDDIEGFCLNNKVICYRGDEDHVLSRFLD